MHKDAADDVHWLDCTGLMCPMPILELAKHARRASGGSRLGVLGTDPALPGDLRAWAAANGHELLELSEEGGAYRGVVRLRGGAAD